MRHRGLAATALAVLAVTASAGCVNDDDAQSPTAAAKPLGHESAGASVQFADCGDWRNGTHAERLATIEQLRGHLTPGRSETAASPLSDQRAYEVFDRACAPEYASSFRLYKLYVRAQGFAPLSE
jgi:hypothetical protein